MAKLAAKYLQRSKTDPVGVVGFDLAGTISIFGKENNRPGQPNREYTMWTFQDISVTQILRENNFGHFEAS